MTVDSPETPSDAVPVRRPIGVWLFCAWYVIIFSAFSGVFLLGAVRGVQEPLPGAWLVAALGWAIALNAAYQLFRLAPLAPAATSAVAAYTIISTAYKWITLGHPGGLPTTLIALWAALYAWRLQRRGMLVGRKSA